MKFGVDVSHWQGNVNWDLAKDRGVEFVYLKGTDFTKLTGVGFEDSKLRQNVKDLDRLQIPYGIYHWLQPNVDGLKQADYFLSVYHSIGCSLPPVVDFEDQSFLDKNKYLYRLQQWLERVFERTNKKPVVYTRKSFINQFDKKRVGFLSSYGLWQALYPVPQARYKNELVLFIKPKPFYPFTRGWLIWQYSEKGDGKYYGAQSAQIDLNWMKDEADDVVSKINVMVTATSGLRVRKDPSTNAEILKTLPYKTIVTVDLDNSTSEWYKLLDEPGYIFKSYTSFVP